MGKIGKLRKKFTAFVNQLSPDQVREQLILCYLQMERCQQVLRGEKVEPVEMKDNGESSDLELFYTCKKVREELDILNQYDKGRKKHQQEKVVKPSSCNEVGMTDIFKSIESIVLYALYLDYFASFDERPKLTNY